MARDIDGGRAVVEVDAALDQKSVRKVARELKASLAAVDTSFKVEAELSKQSLAQVRRDLRAGLANVNVNIGVSITKKSLTDLRRQISTMLSKAFQINIAVSKANLARIKTEIREALQSETAVGVHVPKGDLVALRAAIKAAIPKEERVKVNLDISAFDKLATTMGRLFGRGARNNFFNLTGILVEGTIRGVIALGGAIQKIAGFFTDFGKAAVKAFENGAGAAASMAAGFAATGVNLPALGISLGVVAVALGAVLAVAGPLVATLFSLAGAAIAVGTALTGALVGGAVVAVAAMGPLVAIVGSLAAAWLLASKNQKDAFKQMIQDAVLDKLKDTILEANEVLIEGLGPSLETVGDVLARFKPAILGVASSLNILGEEIADSLDSKEFAAFQKSINEELPRDTLKLGRILSDTFAGFGGTMVALQPAVDQFLGRLGETMQNFNDFANSAEGKASLSEFFLQAEEALGSLGGLIKDTGALFAEMFNGAAGDEGISLIDSFAGKIRDLTDYMKANPGKVREFFEGASDVARSVGNAIVFIVQELGKLNTEGNRDAAELYFAGLAGAAKLAVVALRSVAFVLDHVTNAFGAYIELKGKASNNTELQDMGRALRNLGSDATLTGADIKFLQEDISNLKLQGSFKLNADSSTITVATEEAKKLLVESGILARYPEIEIKVDSKSVTDAGKELDTTKGKVDNLDGSTATINVKVKASIDKLVQDVLDTFGGGIFADASGGVMKAGKQIAGGTPIKMASGGIVVRPTFFGNVLTGEDGPEAIVPLRRPLSQVHDSVRDLSAVAQGKAGGGSTEVTNIFNISNVGATDSLVSELNWWAKYGAPTSSLRAR